MSCYVISRMYAGSYLEDNLGGEAINLLHDDHGNNYVSIGKLGFIDPKYNNQVKGVILTRLVKDGVFEVLGIALTDENSQVAFKGNIDKCKEHQREYITSNDIRYGGAFYKDIYPGPYVGGEISFKSKELLLPHKTIYILDRTESGKEYDGVTTFPLNDKRFPKTSLHSYIDEKINKESFVMVNKIINDASLWRDRNSKNQVKEGRIIDQNYCLLDIIKKDFDELAYSNYFSYIFKTYPNVMVSFAKDILGVSLSPSFKIYREKADIDLYIEDDNNILVIENKIKSGINGISPNHDFSENGKVQSQLEKYFEYVETIKGHKKASYYLFVPNYNKIDLKKYKGSQHYQVIRYKDIYDYLAKVEIKDIYYEEFIKALYKHTKDREIDYAEDMAYRFLKMINKVKK